MSDFQTDPQSPTENDPGPDTGERADALVPLPVHDEATVELVRDAIAVARGEFSDERFSKKYGTAGESADEPDPSTIGVDGDSPDR
ncbi:hypothetical protein FK85_01530 [Halorubrum saccharovorum]|uniref:Uncharacterized protein n=1 Tax=Halorubrum saccharovorum TaxID=2248 RepID=A0A081EXR5_9EURY|nr:hypothetical protein [Halorubrum saccharovorum]KDS92203.1 hypothetical protein FK85_01530 [Halorubrum saccharovorum]